MAIGKVISKMSLTSYSIFTPRFMKVSYLPIPTGRKGKQSKEKDMPRGVPRPRRICPQQATCRQPALLPPFFLHEVSVRSLAREKEEEEEEKEKRKREAKRKGSPRRRRLRVDSYMRCLLFRYC